VQDAKKSRVWRKDIFQATVSSGPPSTASGAVPGRGEWLCVVTRITATPLLGSKTAPGQYFSSFDFVCLVPTDDFCNGSMAA